MSDRRLPPAEKERRRMMRVLSKFTVDDGCWLWRAALDTPGYGHVWWNGRLQRAHRVVYELLVGPIPDGLTLDHLCRVRDCVRPSHLEPVTIGENIRRARSVITHCPHGHPYDDENTRIYSGRRYCRTCTNGRRRRRPVLTPGGTT